MNALKLLKQDVLGVNAPLKEVIETMDPILLLRNCHPFSRGEYAILLKEEGIISKEEAKEFVKILGHVSH